MFVGKEHVGETWTDVLGWSQDNVKIDDEGFGTFNCPGISMSIVSCTIVSRLFEMNTCGI